jgi:hypothetical protein
MAQKYFITTKLPKCYTFPMLPFILWPLLYAIAYFALFYLLPLFWNQPRHSLPKRWWRTITFFIVAILVILILSEFIIRGEMGNRLQHTAGGGILAFYLYFCAMRDAHIRITPLQFLIFGLLTVTALGVANELMEFFMQSFHIHTSAITAIVTWLDLTSNTIGATIAGTWLTWKRWR